MASEKKVVYLLVRRVPGSNAEADVVFGAFLRKERAEEEVPGLTNSANVSPGEIIVKSVPLHE